MSSYTAPPYVPTSAISLFGKVPRFGRPDDVSKLITGESSYVDYAIGVSFIAVTILALFLLWIILLIIFKCCGKRVGVLSGQRLKDGRENWLVRVITMFTAALALVAGIVYLMTATSSLNDTFDSIRDGATDLSSLAVDITNVANDLISEGDTTKPIRDSFVSLMENGVCSSFNGGNGQPVDVDSKVQTAVDILTTLSDFTSGQLTDLRDTFSSQFISIDSQVTSYLDTAQNYSRISYYAYGIIAISSIFYIGAFMAWFAPQRFTAVKPYFFFQSWIVLPMFFLILIITAIFAAAIGTALVVNSDICTSGEANSPESLLKVWLDSQSIDGVAREAIDHYIVNGCSTDFSGTQQLDNLVVTLEEGYTVVNDLKQVIESNIGDFELACGGTSGSLSPVVDSFDAMRVAAANFILIGYDGQDLLKCEGLNDIYIGLSHGSICNYMPETLSWMFITMTIILGAGMVLITCRAALKPDKFNEIDDDYVVEYQDDDGDVKSLRSIQTPSMRFPNSNRSLNTNEEGDYSLNNNDEGDYSTSDFTDNNYNTDDNHDKEDTESYVR